MSATEKGALFEFADGSYGLTDENDEIVHWTVCREREPPSGSITL